MHGPLERSKASARRCARSWRDAGERASIAAAEEPPPMVLAKTGYLFAGGKIDASVPRLADDRADVRRIFHPEDADAPLPRRDDPRRQPDRHELHRHAGRPRRLGAVFRAPRPRRLCGRSGGARPLGAFLAVAGHGRRRQPRSAPSSASSRPSASTCGRRPSCTRNGPAPASPATRRSTRSTPRSFPRSSASRSSRRSIATPASRCSTRSARRSC